MGPGLRRLRADSRAASIARLNRAQQSDAERRVAAARPAALPRVTYGTAEQLRAGLRAALLATKEDCARLHKAARGKERERLYGELLGYDAALRIVERAEKQA